MKDEELKTPIYIINRQTGNIEKVIKTKKLYIQIYSQFCKMSDVETGLKVWCDFNNQEKREVLREFSLIELVNTFSTKYMARLPIRRKK